MSRNSLLLKSKIKLIHENTKQNKTKLKQT